MASPVSPSSALPSDPLFFEFWRVANVARDGRGEAPLTAAEALALWREHSILAHLENALKYPD